ncbi:Dual specificity protein phosphatase 16 [Nymphon striatum]|nr:Dual specificity protein phosphatase 16 [Nymphon striatum]
MDPVDLINSVNVIEVHYLAAVVKNCLEGVLVVDSRSFLEYNTAHVINSVNVSCSKIIKRRLQQDKLTIKELLSHTCQCEADDSCDVIVYDQSSSHTSNVPVDSFLHVLLRKLVPVFRSVNLVRGGFIEFQAANPSLCEHKTRKPTTLTSVSQPCLPVTNLGPTKILPFVYLGSQNDALNEEIVQQYNITYELNVSTSCPKPDFIADNQFMRIPVNDNYSEKLIPFFPHAFQFLDRVRESNACVLIHCLAGISRSATVAIAYVMKHLRMSSDDAYRYVKSKRSTISPNFNFLGQLLEFEKQLKSLNFLNVESEVSIAPVINEVNQKKRPCSGDYSHKLQSLALTIPEALDLDSCNKTDQSPTTAFAKLSFQQASENQVNRNLNDDEKCPCLLKRRKEDSDTDSDVYSHTSFESENYNRKHANYDSKSSYNRSLYGYDYLTNPYKSDISKSQRFDYSSYYTSYHSGSRKSSYSCCSDRRSSSDSLKLDNFDIEVQGIPFSSLSELSFTPCQTSASSSASNSHEGTPERSFGYPRLINRRAGSETRILSKVDFFRTDDSRSRRSPTPSSLSGCSSQKSSRRGSGTTDDDSDALLRRYNSSTWYVPSLESIDSLSGAGHGRTFIRNDSISTSGLGSEPSDFSDLYNEVHSACESLVSDASCSSLCSSSLSRGSSISSRHDLLRPLSVSSSSEAMVTDNDSDCGEGHLSDVEEEIEEEEDSVVFRCDRQSPVDVSTKRSSSDSAYQSLTEATIGISDLISNKELLNPLSSSSNRVHTSSRSPISPSEMTFSEDILPLSESCTRNAKITQSFDDAISSFSSEVKKTNIVYLPLIDMAPADPSTMMLAMLKAQKISQEINQDYVVFTCDQQLYRVALHVKWENPAELSNVYLRLGGMHLLMSYCGCIGTLMADTGIVDVLSAAFGGVLKMLTGKKYPQNVRALGMLVEELLRPIFDNNELETMSGLQQVLDDVASHRDISSKVLMVSPVQGRAVLDINAAVEVHKLIIPDLLAAHGLTGCDTVASCYGIGKRVALKVLRSNKHKLNYLGNTDVDLTDVVEQATHFMIACYGQSGCSSFTEARTKLWSRKFGRSKVTAPKLCALPPTTEAFKENVARAHLQVSIWLHALDQDPPSLEPNEHGWSQEEGSNVNNLITVPADILLAPPELLKLIKCSCKNSGTKMEVENFLSMWGLGLQDSLEMSHDSGISIASQSPHWNEPKDFKIESLSDVSEEVNYSDPEYDMDMYRKISLPRSLKCDDTNSDEINMDSQDVLSSDTCDNLKTVSKDRKWEDILKEKLAAFASLSNELQNELQKNSSSNVGLYRAQSCPGISGILMQSEPSSVVLEATNVSKDTNSSVKGLLRQREKGSSSRIQDKFKNRYSCGSLDYSDHDKRSTSFDSCPDVLQFGTCTNESKSSEKPSPSSPNHQVSFRRSSSIIQVS